MAKKNSLNHKLKKRIATLTAVNIFAETGEALLKDIAAALFEVKVKKGETVFHKGEPGDAMYIIEEGEAKVYNEDFILSRLKKNQVFGEYSLVEMETRTASVTATKDLQLLRLDREDFHGILANNSEIIHGILKSLIKHMQEKEALDKALSKSKERFQKIFDHTNDAIFIINPKEDKIIDVNPMACQMLGYARKELLSIPISNIHPDEMPIFMSFSRQVLKERTGWTDELSCRTRTGKRLPSEISASIIEIEGEKSIIALVRDITKRKKSRGSIEKDQRGIGNEGGKTNSRAFRN